MAVVAQFERPGYGEVHIIAAQVTHLAPFTHGDGTERTVIYLQGGTGVEVFGNEDDVTEALFDKKAADGKK